MQNYVTKVQSNFNNALHNLTSFKNILKIFKNLEQTQKLQENFQGNSALFTKLKLFCKFQNNLTNYKETEKTLESCKLKEALDLFKNSHKAFRNFTNFIKKFLTYFQMFSISLIVFVIVHYSFQKVLENLWELGIIRNRF